MLKDVDTVVAVESQKVAVAALFGPPQDGMVKDDGSASVVDAIAKGISKS